MWRTRLSGCPWATRFTSLSLGFLQAPFRGGWGRALGVVASVQRSAQQFPFIPIVQLHSGALCLESLEKVEGEPKGMEGQPGGRGAGVRDTPGPFSPHALWSGFPGRDPISVLATPPPSAKNVRSGPRAPAALHTVPARIGAPAPPAFADPGSSPARHPAACARALSAQVGDPPGAPARGAGSGARGGGCGAHRAAALSVSK